MVSRPLFLDRAHAGRALACALRNVAAQRDVVVLGLARGGVPVAREVADALDAPLDVLVVRKLGVPGIREVAVGAIAEGSDRVVDDAVGWYIGVPSHVVARIAMRERAELERRAFLYHAGRPIPDVRGRTVVLVDDGLATGATLRAAAFTLRDRRPAHIMVAVPVACRESADELCDEVDHVVAAVTPEPFGTVSDWYEDFSPVSDADVLRLLGCAPEVPVAHGASPRDGPRDERTVTIPVDGDSVAGDLGLPNDLPDGAATLVSTEPRGLVVLAHGGGSSRHSYRNRYLAGRLRLAGWATLRLDLLLDEREQAQDAERGALRFDVTLIAHRLLAAIDWASREHVPGANRVVLFGASTGAAAALVAAAERPRLIAGVATRGGRVDLASDALRRVRAPVLMVLGSADVDTLRQNSEAKRVLRSARLEVVAGAGHTFEEPGALGAVGERVARWLDGLSRTAGERMWRHVCALPARIADLPGATMLDRLTNVRGHHGRHRPRPLA